MTILTDFRYLHFSLKQKDISPKNYTVILVISWKLILFTKYFYRSELYAFEIKLFRIHRTTQYFPKSFQTDI